MRHDEITKLRAAGFRWVSLRMPNELHEELKRAAAAEERSLHRFILRTLRERVSLPAK